MTRYTALCIPLFLGTAARAADEPVIAVVGLHQDGVHLGDQERASKALAKVIENSNRASAVSGPRVGVTIAGRQQIILEEALLATGRTLLGEGRNRYNQAQPAEAVPILNEAIERLEEGVAVSGDTRDLWDARIILGTCYVALDDAFAAERSFRTAIALNPGRVPDPAKYPPDVTDRYNAMLGETDGIATVQITAPSPLEVEVDGREVGSTPVTLEDLRPGTHHVLGRGPGVLAQARLKLVGDPVELELVPTSPSLGDAAETPVGRARQTTDLYRAFGRHTEGVDYVLLAGTDATVLHVQLYDVAADTFSKPTSVPYEMEAIDEAEQMVPMLLNLLDGAGELPTLSTQPSAVPLDRGNNPQLAALLTEPLDTNTRPKRRRKTGLWIGLGAGVLAIAGGATAVGLATRGPQYDGKITIGAL